MTTYLLIETQQGHEIFGLCKRPAGACLSEGLYHKTIILYLIYQTCYLLLHVFKMPNLLDVAATGYTNPSGCSLTDGHRGTIFLIRIRLIYEKAWLRWPSSEERIKKSTYFRSEAGCAALMASMV